MAKKLLSVTLSLLLVCLGLYAQQQPVFTGTVVDEKGEPLSGASLVAGEESKPTATALTDHAGKFSMRVATGTTVTVKYVGYLTRQIASSATAARVVMQPDAHQLEEMVVVGYGAIRKSDMTTAVATVNVSELAKSGSSMTLEALQGKVSGVQITSEDGSLNSEMTIKIRGLNSISGSIDPLFVIDGAPQPIGYKLSTLNTNDIESMTVLKDASAAAIYGVDGSSGVVIINTKQGGDMTRPKLDFQLRTSVDFVPENKMQVLNAEEFTYKLNDFTNSNAERNGFIQYLIANQLWNDPTVARNWMNEIQGRSNKYEINGSLSGGSKTQTYMLSMGYMQNNGIIRTTALDRFTLRLNLTQKVGKNLKVTFNSSYAYLKDHNAFTDYSKNGPYIKALLTNPYLTFGSYRDIFAMGGDDRVNPLLNLTDRDVDYKKNELNGKLGIDLNLMKELVFTTSFAIRKSLNSDTKFTGPTTGAGYKVQGIMEFENFDYTNWTYEARLQYTKTFCKKHKLTAMAAFEAKQAENISSYAGGTNFSDFSLGGIWAIETAGKLYQPDHYYDSSTSASVLGRVVYSYSDRYVLQVSLRRDASSKFGVNNKWATFPAASVAWRVSEEKFMKPVNFISNLRLRGSFGLTGSNGFPAYRSLPIENTYKVVFDNTTVVDGRTLSQIPNPDLKWERSKQYNAGIDLGVLKNRLTVTADWYYKRIDDMLMNINIPFESGFTTAWANAGSMENTGIEFAVNASLIQKRNFRWTADFNIAFNQNKLIALSEGQYERFFDRGINQSKSDVVLRVGMPVGIYYGYINDGVYNNDTEVLNGHPGFGYGTGQLKVVDVNRDGVIDTHDRVPVANVNPIHTGGLGTTFGYKGLELYAFLRWSYGNDVVNGNIYYLTTAKNTHNMLRTAYYNVHTSKNPDNNYPEYATGDFGPSILRSEVVEDGSFLRLSTLTLGYTFNDKLVRKIGLSRLKLSVTGNNLWIWSRYSGFDPEANTQGYGTLGRVAAGLDMSPYPRTRSVLFSLEIGL